jgi:hypothetical protein
LLQQEKAKMASELQAMEDSSAAPSHQDDGAYLANHPNENGTVEGSKVPFLAFSRGITDAGHL